MENFLSETQNRIQISSEITSSNKISINEDFTVKELLQEEALKSLKPNIATEVLDGIPKDILMHLGPIAK